MKPNYGGNKKRKEEARRKKQEEKRNRRLNKSQTTPEQAIDPVETPSPETPPFESNA